MTTVNYDPISFLQSIEDHAAKQDLYAFTSGPNGLVAVRGGRFGRFFAWIGHCLGIRTNAQLIHKFVLPYLKGLGRKLAEMKINATSQAPDFVLVSKIKILAQIAFCQEHFKTLSGALLCLAREIEPDDDFQEVPNTFNDASLDALLQPLIPPGPATQSASLPATTAVDDDDDVFKTPPQVFDAITAPLSRPNSSSDVDSVSAPGSETRTPTPRSGSPITE